MMNDFWDVVDKSDRVKLFNDLNLDTEIDVVLSILTFEHIGYRTPNNIMDIRDITFEIMEYTHPGTIWVLVEHEVEEPGWIDRWCGDFNINPDNSIIFKAKLLFVINTASTERACSISSGAGAKTISKLEFLKFSIK